MDLIATVTRSGNVDVWRLNGQRVFGASFDHGEEDVEGDHGVDGVVGKVKAVCWRRDGEFPPVFFLLVSRSRFAAGWSMARQMGARW